MLQPRVFQRWYFLTWAAVSPGIARAWSNIIGSSTLSYDIQLLFINKIQPPCTSCFLPATTLILFVVKEVESPQTSNSLTCSLKHLVRLVPLPKGFIHPHRYSASFLRGCSHRFLRAYQGFSYKPRPPFFSLAAPCLVPPIKTLASRV